MKGGMGNEKRDGRNKNEREDEDEEDDGESKIMLSGID